MIESRFVTVQCRRTTERCPLITLEDYDDSNIHENEQEYDLVQNPYDPDDAHHGGGVVIFPICELRIVELAHWILQSDYDIDPVETETRIIRFFDIQTQNLIRERKHQNPQNEVENKRLNLNYTRPHKSPHHPEFLIDLQIKAQLVHHTENQK